MTYIIKKNVYCILYQGREYATIDIHMFASSATQCLVSGDAQLSMTSTQDSFLVIPHIQDKSDSAITCLYFSLATLFFRYL